MAPPYDRAPMRLTILSRSTSIYTTRRLVEAARERGASPRVVDPLDVEMGLGERPALYWRRKKFPATDVVIPRIGLSVHQYGLSVVNQLELMGTPVLNGSYGIAASRNKMRSLQLLAAAGVPVPRTVMASDASGIKQLVRLVGGVPVLVKLISGNERSGAMICESMQSLEAALQAILGLGHDIVVQQYLRGARGRDLRLLVVGGEVEPARRPLLPEPPPRRAVRAGGAAGLVRAPRRRRGARHAPRGLRGRHARREGRPAGVRGERVAVDPRARGGVWRGRRGADRGPRPRARAGAPRPAPAPGRGPRGPVNVGRPPGVPAIEPGAGDRP
jgi:ribosomal protein S6--L-glutamate ligase